MAISANNFIEENIDSEDSEPNSNVEDNVPDYYQPISAVDDGSSDQDEDLDETTNDLPNGHVGELEGKGEKKVESVEDLEAAALRRSQQTKRSSATGECFQGDGCNEADFFSGVYS